MKTIFSFILGILFGILTIDFAIDAVVCLFHLFLLSMLWKVGLTILFGYISLACFKKI